MVVELDSGLSVNAFSSWLSLESVGALLSTSALRCAQALDSMAATAVDQPNLMDPTDG